MLQPKEETSLILGISGVDNVMNEGSSLASRLIEEGDQGIVLCTPEELYTYVFDELYQRTRKGRSITPEYFLSLQYIAKLLSELRTPLEFDDLGISITSEQYVSDEFLEGNYRQAGDNAIYGYIHTVGKRKNSLSYKDYIDLAEMCFYKWHESKPQSLGRVIAENVRGILERIEYWKKDMMVRMSSVQQ